LIDIFAQAGGSLVAYNRDILKKNAAQLDTSVAIGSCDNRLE